MISIIANLLKLGSWTLLTLIIGAVITKVIATTAGPVGIGYFSLIRQLQQTFVSLATFSGDSAIVQGISSRADSRKSSYAFNTGKILATNLLFISVVSMITIFIFQDFLLRKTGFKESTHLYFLLIPAVFASLGVYLVGVLNGFGKTRLTTKLQTAAAFSGLICALLFLNNLEGLSYAIILSAVAISTFIFSLYHVCKLKLMSRNLDCLTLESARNDAQHFFSISSVALLVGFSGAGTLLLVRFKLTLLYGVEGAGIFDAAWTLSAMYLVIFLGTFGTYFLPKLSALTDNTEFSREIERLMHLSLLISVILIAPVTYIKPFLFNLLYSHEFSDSLHIFKWMLIGDYFKISAWVLSIPMLARAFMRPYFILSISWNIAFMILAYLFTSWSGNIEFVGLAYLITQICYVVASYYYWVKYHSIKFSLTIWRLWLLGLFVVIFSSFVSWNQFDANIFGGLSMVIALIAFLYIGIGEIGRNFIKNKLNSRRIND